MCAAGVVNKRWAHFPFSLCAYSGRGLKITSVEFDSHRLHAITLLPVSIAKSDLPSFYFSFHDIGQFLIKG